MLKRSVIEFNLLAWTWIRGFASLLDLLMLRMSQNSLVAFLQVLESMDSECGLEDGEARILELKLNE